MVAEDDGGRTSDCLLTIPPPPLGKERSAFSAELLQAAEEGPLANDDWHEGNRILLRIEKKRGRVSVVVDANGTLKNVLELADANAALRCIA